MVEFSEQCTSASLLLWITINLKYNRFIHSLVMCQLLNDNKTFSSFTCSCNTLFVALFSWEKIYSSMNDQNTYIRCFGKVSSPAYHKCNRHASILESSFLTINLVGQDSVGKCAMIKPRMHGCMITAIILERRCHTRSLRYLLDHCVEDIEWSK